MNRPLVGIDADVLRRLASYPFPGNIRELENMIERAIVIGQGKKIRLKDLPLTDHDSYHSAESLSEFEKVFIRQALERSDWNISRTARALGIDRVTLYNKIRKHGLKHQE
jgi:transcriptional regulator of acetoin/glycerol metabolism